VSHYEIQKDNSVVILRWVSFRPLLHNSGAVWGTSPHIECSQGSALQKQSVVYRFIINTHTHTHTFCQHTTNIHIHTNTYTPIPPNTPQAHIHNHIHIDTCKHTHNRNTHIYTMYTHTHTYAWYSSSAKLRHCYVKNWVYFSYYMNMW
jgi:hypothetical protein